MPSQIAFTGPNGQSPERVVNDLISDILPSAEAMLFAASRQITRIRERTAAGKDVNGAGFAPYSQKYGKLRIKRGRNASPVDLTNSGRLLNSLRPETRGEAAFAITVQDSEAAAYGRAINDGTSNQPQRRWFDTSQAELDQMRDDLASFANRK